jgi:hypothetical protein
MEPRQGSASKATPPCICCRNKPRSHILCDRRTSTLMQGSQKPRTGARNRATAADTGDTVPRKKRMSEPISSGKEALGTALASGWNQSTTPVSTHPDVAAAPSSPPSVDPSRSAEVGHAKPLRCADRVTMRTASSTPSVASTYAPFWAAASAHNPAPQPSSSIRTPHRPALPCCTS